MFTQFIFNVVIDTVGFTSVTILLLIFYLSHLFFDSSPSFLPSLGLIEFFFFFNVVFLISSMCIQMNKFLSL